jgi:formate dehydrogenase maturation protein FdhE
MTATTARYDTDTCPACGSTDVIPYAVLIGATEEYGYQCTACLVMWPVLLHPPAIAMVVQPGRNPQQ